MHANDLTKALRVIEATTLLTAQDLSTHLLPQLLYHLDQSSGTVDTAVRAAGNNTAAAIESLQGRLQRDLAAMTSALVKDHVGAMEATGQRVVAAVTSNIEDIVAASSSTTVAVLSSTLRNLIEEAVNTAGQLHKNDDDLNAHLASVATSTWVAALQDEIRQAAAQVQEHTNESVRMATVQLSSQTQCLQQTLVAASLSTRDELRALEQTLLRALTGIDHRVKAEAEGVVTTVKAAELSVLDRISVLHEGLSGELHDRVSIKGDGNSAGKDDRNASRVS